MIVPFFCLTSSVFYLVSISLSLPLSFLHDLSQKTLLQILRRRHWQRRPGKARDAEEPQDRKPACAQQLRRVRLAGGRCISWLRASCAGLQNRGTGEQA